MKKFLLWLLLALPAYAGTNDFTKPAGQVVLVNPAIASNSPVTLGQVNTLVYSGAVVTVVMGSNGVIVTTLSNGVVLVSLSPTNAAANALTYIVGIETNYLAVSTQADVTNTLATISIGSNTFSRLFLEALVKLDVTSGANPTWNVFCEFDGVQLQNETNKVQGAGSVFMPFTTVVSGGQTNSTAFTISVTSDNNSSNLNETAVLERMRIWALP
jgi:hypothetical protein